mmetsp:Transcript_19863/g.62150  ORF Transcript_19863/g.62150 Transcript_19863/m.62150 type:complete len:312 (+) Transcript_19863:1300-2235(+)
MSWYDWFSGGAEEARGASDVAAGGGSCRQGATEPTGSVRRHPSGALTRGDPFVDPCERVLVRVYDLGTTFLLHPHNAISRSYGAFHTGVEVFGREWSFGMAEDWRTGVTWCPPGKNPDHTFRETLAMGFTKCNFAEFTQILNEMKQEWRGSSYSLLTRNCHHFSDALCGRLGVGRLPPWINDLAGVGDATATAFDKVYSSVSISDAFSSVKSGLYLTFTGVPECLSGRRRPELQADGEAQDPDEESDDPDDPRGPACHELRSLPPTRGDLVYPARGEAVLVFHTMGGAGSHAAQRSRDDDLGCVPRRHSQD